MKTAITVLLLCIGGVLQAQNIVITKIPGTTHYEMKFKNVHRLGDIGEQKYPHVQIYCRANDSSMIVFKFIIERQGTMAVGEGTTPIFISDGDKFKSNNVMYQSFPLDNGVIETFTFYAPEVQMLALANSDDVKLDIGGAEYEYPQALRNDYKELYKMCYTRNKDSLLAQPSHENSPGME